MSQGFWGPVTMVDTESGTMIWGQLAFLSDGQSRSEIIVTDPDTEQEERLVFSTGSSWRPVFHLIETMRRLYADEEGDPFPESEGR